MSTIAAIDLVMAMPVSWLPLVADYARYGKLASQDPRHHHSAFTGTWLGYTLANVWCYALGVLVVSTSAPDTDLVTTLLLAQFGLVALGLILIDELDNAYGDVHSGAVSLNVLIPRHGLHHWGKLLSALAILAAMFLPMHSLEPFLLLLSSIFVPLFGVILTQLTFAGHATHKRIHWGAALIWVLGIAVFHLTPLITPTFGSALPSLLVTLILGAAYRRWMRLGM
jgi:NCS1 family nucleobase:cation symporter-1